MSTKYLVKAACSLDVLRFGVKSGSALSRTSPCRETVRHHILGPTSSQSSEYLGLARVKKRKSRSALLHSEWYRVAASSDVVTSPRLA